VAEDSKDYYFNNGKPRIRSFQIGKIEFQEDGIHAVVTLIAKVIMTAPGLAATEIPVTARHTWKLESGDWSWYIDQKAEIDTPFGKMRPGGADVNGSPAGLPDFTKPQNMVSIDRTSIDLSNGLERVTISNHLPGSIDLRIGNHPQGLIVEMDKSHLAQGENAVISFRAADGARPSGEAHVTALPTGQEFVVHIIQK
jgi:hypothetical protein